MEGFFFKLVADKCMYCLFYLAPKYFETLNQDAMPNEKHLRQALPPVMNIYVHVIGYPTTC